jgi:hypothetical protein
MLIVCPNWATSYGAEMASLWSARGRMRHQQIYSWTAASARGSVPAGDTLAFHSMLKGQAKATCIVSR